MNRAAVLSLLLALATPPAAAETGEYLAKRAPAYERFVTTGGSADGMMDEEVTAASELVRYVVAVLDTHNVIADATGGKTRFYCTPPGSTRAQALDAVLRWVKRNPERAKVTSAPSVVLIALGEAAPCRGR